MTPKWEKPINSKYTYSLLKKKKNNNPVKENMGVESLYISECFFTCLMFEGGPKANKPIAH